ncbi:hypothetical protein B0H67DRAFT_643977 [Lasiosphaeris hirsuta]|uniref:DUF6594 domain-containing protein n=1 Tax=Lasiosphaeris hirsuta TaxID=260670 RepID=A0AA40ARP9_9PEZI|nr:hypothetical protein B0H67DRAFT_643977 [Lasiosphaeris hirsuta]
MSAGGVGELKLMEDRLNGHVVGEGKLWADQVQVGACIDTRAADERIQTTYEAPLRAPERVHPWRLLGGNELFYKTVPMLQLLTSKKENPIDGGSSTSAINYASGRKIAIFISHLSTILAAILLFGDILVLYSVKLERLKLGLVALFTAVFATSVGLLTNAKRSEVYGSTAAYATVLVVFVSGNLEG